MFVATKHLTATVESLTGAVVPGGQVVSGVATHSSKDYLLVRGGGGVGEKVSHKIDT